VEEQEDQEGLGDEEDDEHVEEVTSRDDDEDSVDESDGEDEEEDYEEGEESGDEEDPEESVTPEEDHLTFNKWVRELTYDRSIEITAIIENKFYCNWFEGGVSNIDKDAKFGDVISACRYLVCLTHGMYGIRVIRKKDKTFDCIQLFDIGRRLPDLD